jgi:RNA 3'-terminal phosphate cyclase (ATP)
MPDLVRIDGSRGEGGGQMLRSSLALSLLTGKPVSINRIRAGRKKPGLQPQHRLCVQAAAKIGSAKTKGVDLGSTRIEFEPGSVVSGPYQFEVGTAGSCSLVLHTLYLPLALRGSTASEVSITGGTHVTHSPTYDFLAGTWSRYLELIGIRVGTRLRRAGFYPRGGGVLEARIEPCQAINGINLEAFEPATLVHIRSMVSGLPESIADRQAERAAELLEEMNLTVEVTRDIRRDGLGTAVALELATKPVSTTFTALGERGKRAETVAEEAVEQVRTYLARPAGVDHFSADQLLLPLALAEGSSSFAVEEVTLHLLTNIEVIRSFVDRDIECKGNEGDPGCVRIE